MDAATVTLTFNDIVRAVVVVAILWKGGKILTEIIKSINNRHDKEKKWDETEGNLRKELQEDVCQYNKQLNDIRKRQDDIRTDFEAKVQEVKAEQFIIIECLKAVLDGLHQQGCNGPVTEAIKNLDKYLNERAHD